MASRNLIKLVQGFTFLESPRWHEGRLWLSDFHTHRVLAVSLDGTVENIAVVPAQPSGLGWLPDGRMLVVSMKDRKLLRREADGSLVVHADLSGLATWHLNDMVVDEKGRAYIGNFGFDHRSGGPVVPASLIMVAPDGRASVVSDNDLIFPNGSAITPDGRTLLVGETWGNRISAFPINGDGSLGARYTWASFGELTDSREFAVLSAAAKVLPDGCTLDAQGCLWVADIGGNRAIRVKEGGAIVDEISSGADGTFAVCLGGEHGKTLFICVAPHSEPSERIALRGARVMMTEVDVPHAGRP